MATYCQLPAAPCRPGTLMHAWLVVLFTCGFAHTLRVLLRVCSVWCRLDSAVPRGNMQHILILCTVPSRFALFFRGGHRIAGCTAGFQFGSIEGLRSSPQDERLAREGSPLTDFTSLRQPAASPTPSCNQRIQSRHARKLSKIQRAHRRIVDRGQCPGVTCDYSLAAARGGAYRLFAFGFQIH
jgi:hypothetical protein